MTSINNSDDYTPEKKSEASPPLLLFQHLYQSPVAPRPPTTLPAASMGQDDDDEQGPRFQHQARSTALLQPVAVSRAIDEEDIDEAVISPNTMPKKSGLWNASSLVPIRFSHLYQPATAVTAGTNESFTAQDLDATGSEAVGPSTTTTTTTTDDEQKGPRFKDQMQPNRFELAATTAAIQGPSLTTPGPTPTSSDTAAAATVFLAEALPVSDTQISGEDQLREQHQQAAADFKKYRRMIRIGAAVVLLVLIAVAVGGFCVGSGDRCRRRSGGDNNLSSVVPAAGPPARPAVDVELLRSYFNGITLSNQTLRYPSHDTAEERALRWLIEVDVATSVTGNDLALVQRYALATLWFQHPSGGPAFDDNAGFVSTWTTELHECNWQGVKCDFSGQVNGLNLNHVGIRGRLPNDVALLTALTLLDLWRVALTGTIPSSLGRLTDLTYLSFSENQLSGSLPAWWDGSTSSTTSKLTVLNLFQNALTGTIPSFMALTDLTTLQLGYNRLRGTIPSSLTALTALVQLYLNDNRLSGTIPPSIGSSLLALTDVVLSNNQLNGSAPFCNSNNMGNATKTWNLLAADCDKVICSCCTHCCLNGSQTEINHFISC